MVKYHTYFASLIGRPEGYPNNKNNRSLFFIASKYKINIRTQDAAQVSQPLYNAWTDFAKEINANAPEGAGTMVHSAPAWLIMLVETEAVVGSIQAMGISVGAAFIAVTLFTGNLLVSIYTGLSIIIIVIYLGTFIVAALKWPFGAIESICLTIFVGFSVDYVLHIAHKYNEAHQYHSSFLKMRDAITSIGPSIVSASITTTGSAIFLVFCQIYIFQQMGWLLIANTVLAIFVAMLSFSSILSLIGPRGNFCDAYRACQKKKRKKRQSANEVELVRPMQRFLSDAGDNPPEGSPAEFSPVDDYPMPNNHPLGRQPPPAQNQQPAHIQPPAHNQPPAQTQPMPQNNDFQPAVPVQQPAGDANALPWACAACTFQNSSSVTQCRLCGAKRVVVKM